MTQIKLNYYQIIIILLVGFGGGLATDGLINEFKETPPIPIVQFNPDLRDQVQNLNIHVAVLQGQMSAITGRYNDHGHRLQIVEERMAIFNGQ